MTEQVPFPPNTNPRALHAWSTSRRAGARTLEERAVVVNLGVWLYTEKSPLRGDVVTVAEAENGLVSADTSFASEATANTTRDL